ncbi:uncharacterized protein LOC123916787 [Trifolium pratense]|nr:uncharacterized protein LOC123916787 [Trifolium pratense]
MDVKALAKSKRDHTRHLNKKHHGNHKLKTQSQSSFSSSIPNQNDAVKEPFGKQQVIENKTNRSKFHGGSSALPGNWDRYEEEEEEAEFDSVPQSGSKTLDVVVPKSKGADFRHLVAEAQSYADKTLDDFNELVPWEFGVGLSYILAVRGEGILSWDGYDNFVVQDNKTSSANQEASFISLNLHAIAEKLAKVDLSKRLFVEADLLPSELFVEDLAVASDEPDRHETTEDCELAKRISKELNLVDSAADQFTSSSSCSSSHAASASARSNDFFTPGSNINAEFQQVGNSAKNEAFQPSAETNLQFIKDTIVKHSAFEVAAAEKELDMLLDSLDETKSCDSFTVPLGVSSMDLPKISNKEPVQSRILSISTSLDDALDNLLEETSTMMNPHVLSWPQEEKPVHHSMLSSHSQNKEKVSDDFDSWFDTL